MSLCSKELLFGLIIAIGSLNFGISVGLPTPLDPLFKEWQKSDNELLWFNVITSLFAIFGPFIVTFLLNYIGRRLMFAILHIASAIIYIILLFMTKERFYIAIIVRALVGLDIGGFTSLCPTMLIEIAQKEWTGFFGNLHQIGCVVGIIIMYVQGTYAHWKTLCYTSIGVSVLGTCLIWLCPETSPNKTHLEGEVVVKKEKDSLFHEQYTRRLVIGLSMMVIQQFCGINAILSNLDQNFKDAGATLDSGIASTIAMAAQLFGVLICGITVDKLGRRPLFCVSALGSAVMLFLFSLNTQYNVTNWVAIVVITMYLFFFGLALGPIPWFIVPELFPDSVRSMAATMVTMVNQLCSFFVTFLFPWMNEGMGKAAICIIYGIISAFGAIFGFFYIMEPSNSKISREEWDDGDDENDFNLKITLNTL